MPRHFIGRALSESATLETRLSRAEHCAPSRRRGSLKSDDSHKCEWWSVARLSALHGPGLFIKSLSFQISAISSMGGYSSSFFANISSKLTIFDKFSQNSPFYCNFGPKMVEKMRKYKELENNALSQK